MRMNVRLKPVPVKHAQATLMAPRNFHRVLIAAAIGFAFFFTVWAVDQFQQTDNVNQLVLAVASTVVTLALVACLVYFNRNLSVLRHTLASRCVHCGGLLRSDSSADHADCPNCGEAATALDF